MIYYTRTDSDFFLFFKKKTSCVKIRAVTGDNSNNWFYFEEWVDCPILFLINNSNDRFCFQM